MSRGRGSVRLRVTLAAAGIFAAALTGASFLFVHTVRDNLVDEIERTNAEQLDQVVRQIRQGTLPEDVTLPGAALGGQPTFRAVGPNGRPVPDFQVPGGPVADLPPDAPLVRAQRRIFTARGTITLVAQRSLAEVDSTVASATNALLFGVPALVLLVAALTWWIAGRALRPVEAIRAEAAAITATTMSRRVPERGANDEVGRLARTMNSMLDRLEVSARRQRQFVSDASHELRSPIAVIRTQLEVALRRPESTDWPQVARRVLAEDERLADAVSELLELARAEELALDRAASVDVDVDEILLEESARPWPVPVDTTAVSAGRVRGDAAQLGRVVRNLLDNAGRHASSQVAVSLVTDAATVRLTVDDDGPGIEPEDRLRVFDRFTRLDEGRARDAGGVGLGLAMTLAIVARHGGTVRVLEAPLGGARFVVELPAA